MLAIVVQKCKLLVIVENDNFELLPPYVTESSIEIRRDELGNLCLLRYSDFLMKWDAAQHNAEEYEELYHVFNRRATNEISKSLADRWSKISIEEFEITQFEQVIAQPASFAYAYKFVSDKYRNAAGVAIDHVLNYVDSDEQTKTMTWQLDKKVEVELMGAYKFSPETTNRIKSGNLVNVNLDPKKGGELSFRTFWGTLLKIEPIIDREDNYRSTISVTYV